MTAKRYLVTGGTGFLGSALVKRLVHTGAEVRVFDNGSRGAEARLAEVVGQVELIVGDVRDPDATSRACAGVDAVCHLAFVNGTRFFYERPELVLDVGVRGMLNVIAGTLQHGVPELILASSSEVYQTPDRVPTDETVALSVPDPLNPRYSYGGAKIISELLALNYGRQYFKRVVIFRPHNVYGPDMGWEHVVPELTLRVRDLARTAKGPVRLSIQGTGDETRAFIFIDDLIDGVTHVIERGEHLGIYHIGTEEEIRIDDLAREIGRCFGREVEIMAGPLRAGGARRRCPDITKLRGLGFAPHTTLRQGLDVTVRWYDEHAGERPTV